MITVTDLRPIALFDGLTDDQLRQLIEAGTETPVDSGVELFHEGDPADYWCILVDGEIDLFRHVGREDVRVGALDVPGRWSGGFRAWDEHGVCLATGVGAQPGRLLRVPAAALRALLQDWFPFGVHLLAGMTGTARAIESTARQRQSLVRLGTLAAGLAHELNNPAAAAIRNVAALKDSMSTVLASLTALSAEQITADQFAALDAARNEAETSSAPTDSLELADLEDEITSWLEARNVDQAWEVAAGLAAAGIGVDLCASVAAAVPESALSSALTWISSTASVTSLLEQLTDSTRRISELVAATRSYTQMDRGSAQRIDVTEGIESTLTMLAHKLGGVAVIRNYAPDCPQIDAYPGELNQVWTNLIDNAVDAMAGNGTLRLNVRRDHGNGVSGDGVTDGGSGSVTDGGSGGGINDGSDGGSSGGNGNNAGVIVEIGDSGTGMPPEVAARAFEAFFTTKDVGSGTGLGLDIAHRIVVERHGGSIEIDSRPGDTVLRVRLPRQARGA